jgi:hypothetical protein
MTSGLTVLAFPFPCRRQPLDFAGTATAARVGHPNLIPHPCVPRRAGQLVLVPTRDSLLVLLAVEAIRTSRPHIHSFSTNFISSFQHLFPATKRFVSTPPSDCAQRSVTASVLCVECIVERLSVAVTRFFSSPRLLRNPTTRAGRATNIETPGPPLSQPTRDRTAPLRETDDRRPTADDALGCEPEHTV